MQFKENTYEDILSSEREMVLYGVECYGDYYKNAFEFNFLLMNLIKSIDLIDRWIFLAFYSQVKKFHTLALFSAVRRHHVQSLLNLRYVIESGQWAAYALGNIEESKFCRKDSNGIVFVDKKPHRDDMHAWLDKTCKEKAEETKRLKKLISESSAHSNIVYSFQNFKVGTNDKPGFITPFFDFENEYLVKSDLWFVANAALGLLDLFYGVNKMFGVFQLCDDFLIKFNHLVDQNAALKAEMMLSDRFKRSLK